MVDPTSDVGTVSEAEAPRCTVCDDPIVESPDHRVITWVDDDGRIQHRDFCGADCLAAWDQG